MTYIRWFLFLLFWTVVAGFLHYTLPQHDVVRVIDTEVRRTDVSQFSMFWASADQSSGALSNRDVFFVQSALSGGGEMVYRNEDTGWGWPPYFKFNTASLQAELADLRSTRDAPIWVAVRHYGWRSELLSIYPNILSAREVASPDERIIPWMNIIILTSLAALYWAIRVRWLRFRRNRIDPVVEDIGDSVDNARHSMFRGWFKRSDR